MSSLAESQAAFAQAILNVALPAPRDVVRRHSTVAEMPQTKRFDVYRNNVFSAGVDALVETFPAVERLVGEAFFHAAARSFLDATPPTSPILTHIGAEFGTFLDDFPPAAGVPYLGDVARLEYARVMAHHATDADAISISALATVAAEAVGNAVLTPHPSLTLIQSRFPVGSIWAASTDAAWTADVDMNSAEDVLVVRPALDVETVTLPDGGGAFLRALLDGLTIETAAEVGATAHDTFELSDHLAGLFASGAFIAIRIADGSANSREEKAS